MSLLLTNKRRKKIATSSDPYSANVVLYLKGDVNPIVDSGKPEEDGNIGN